MSGFKISSLSGVVTVISGKESADTLTGGDGANADTAVSGHAERGGSDGALGTEQHLVHAAQAPGALVG